jgi:REP-associated tyrosine transposase
MGEPPRLSEIKIPSGTPVIYFVTLCVDGRRPVLENPKVFQAVQRNVGHLRNWRVQAGVVMPDHIHFMITPMKDRGLSAGDFATGFKRVFRRELGGQDWEWQRGCFDRLLRSNESAQQKWIYLEQNPVRAGLVTRVQDWPYYLGSLVEDGKQTASPTEGDGKQTASPTERDGKLTASPTGKEGIS